MTISVNDGGSWKNATPYVNDGGVWKPVQELWVNDGGTWKRVFTAIAFTPVGGNYDVSEMHSAAFTINCTQPAVWTWSRQGDLMDSGASPGSGQSSTYFQCFVNAAYDYRTGGYTTKRASFTVTATAGGKTETYYINLTAYGDQIIDW